MLNIPIRARLLRPCFNRQINEGSDKKAKALIEYHRSVAARNTQLGKEREPVSDFEPLSCGASLSRNKIANRSRQIAAEETI
ncbi:MAG: hypothetical protein BroJett013_12170 [Alphaproteobacteria bacterium]|nr:MAG: hypothetical protein BroJett013_12170 [Alphaproteobacteria bacterium]